MLNLYTVASTTNKSRSLFKAVPLRKILEPCSQVLTSSVKQMVQCFSFCSETDNSEFCVGHLRAQPCSISFYCHNSLTKSRPCDKGDGN